MYARTGATLCQSEGTVQPSAFSSEKLVDLPSKSTHIPGCKVAVTPVWFGSTSQPPGLPPGQLAWGLPISILLLRFSADRTSSGVVGTSLQLTNVADPEAWLGIVTEDEFPPNEGKRLRL